MANRKTEILEATEEALRKWEGDEEGYESASTVVDMFYDHIIELTAETNDEKLSDYRNHNEHYGDAEVELPDGFTFFIEDGENLRETLSSLMTDYEQRIEGIKHLLSLPD